MEKMRNVWQGPLALMVLRSLETIGPLRGMRVNSVLMVFPLTIVIIWLCGTFTQASDWPRFRGPNGSGVSDGRNLPVTFDPGQNVVWKAVIPPGHSSPILTDDRIFLTAYDDKKLLVICLERSTGKELWRRGIIKNRSERRSAGNDPATPTPATDGKNVYAFFSDFGLISYDPQGTERWRVALGPFTVPHGMASSPIAADGKIILVADQAENSYIAAFDQKTGQTAWKTDRLNFVGGYTSPILYKPANGATQVVISGPLELAGYSVETGKKLWGVNGMGVMPISSPVVSKDTFYVYTDAVPPFEMLVNQMKADRNQDGKVSPDEFPDPAFRGAVLAIDREYGNKDGAVDAAEWNRALGLTQGGNNSFLAVSVDQANSQPNQSSPGKIKWRLTKFLTDSSSVLIYKGVIYLVKSGGIVTTINPETGEILKQGRLKGALDEYYASPVAADGKVFFVSQAGKVSVIKAGGNDWEVLAVNDLGEECYATPAIADDRIYIRTQSALYSFGRTANKRS
jgi:outer membrane protein assembly factor BamB